MVNPKTIVIQKYCFFFVLLSTILLSSQPILYAQEWNREIEALIQDIVSDVVNRTTDRAREVVYQSTGIDVGQEEYSRARSHEYFPRDVSDETRRELLQLRREHDRKIRKLEEELEKKLDKAEGEFRREAAKEEKREKVNEKRRKLEAKVDEAYAKFSEKVDEENRRFDEKRDKIISKART
jgi:exonuclease VII large subunit